jgi:hypothetical protein
MPPERNEVKVRRLHSCRRTRDSILDLVFQEKTEPARSLLLSDVEACPLCLEHYLGLEDTLQVFDDAALLAEPDEKAWSAYEARLANKIIATAGERTISIARVKRVFRSSIRVPVPIAAGFAVACLASILVLATRQAPARIVEVPGESKLVEVPGESKTIERVVEVPVYRERTVTRKVYVDRKPTEPVAENRPIVTDKVIDDGLNRVAQASPAEDGGSITRANLTGFQPASDLRIRVIRRGEGENR